MGNTITPVSFTRIPKDEFSGVVNELTRILSKYDLAAMHVDDINKLLLEQTPQLSNLVVTSRKHPITKLMDVQRERRYEVLEGVLQHNQSLVKANLSSQSEQLYLVDPFIEKYWAKLKRFSGKTITERLKLMLLELEPASSLKQATTELGFLAFFDELRMIQAGLLVNHDLRRESKSEMPKAQTKQVKSDLSVALSDLMKAIELARKSHPEVDYNPLVSEINVLFVSYQAEIKSRVTRRKTTAEAIKAAEAAKLNTDDGLK
ncbi:MAG: DUF6261 family protein [Paludibacter sp.]